MKITIYLCFFFQTATLFSQVSLEKYFNNKENQFLEAYQNKDTIEYLSLLVDFSCQFEKLNTKKKEQFLNNKLNAYYNLSCIYSLMNKPSKSTYYLKLSIDNGYSNLVQIQRDSDFDNIRNDSDFNLLVNQLRMLSDFQFILKNDDFYKVDSNKFNQSFYYQSSTNKDLTKLRLTYNLDSIKGNGSEIEKLQNILFWVHGRVIHDGNINNPKIKNAINFIEKCDKKSQGLNCRGMAMLLNECYLSLGYKSKIVCCFPKDSMKVDKDCHVLTTVYSDELKKWIWLDPTMNSLISNSKGQILGINEVRNSLINNDSLYLNKEANWNGKPIDKNQYLYQYMAKNLYYLESPIKSEFNFESRRLFKKYKYLKLAPVNYLTLNKQVHISKSVLFTKNITFYTNNPELFWICP